MLPFHPLADIFPLIEGESFDSFVASVRAAGGIREPIVLLDGMILDGRNRARACDLCGFEPKYAPLQPGVEPIPFVLDKNLHRRHLNEAQRAMVAANLANLPNGGNRAESDHSANLHCGRPKITLDDAAKLLNVSRRSVASAKSVRGNAEPGIRRAVERGKLSIDAAAKASSLPPNKQEEIAKRAEAGEANVVRTVIKQGVRDEREKEIGFKQQAFPDKKYGIILADPEWEFKAWNPVTGIDRSAVQHYPVSDDKVINARNVQKISAPDCILFLWCVDPARGVRALEAWGFEYKTYFVWVKDIVPLAGVPGGYETVGPPGTGYWKRDRCELLLVGTRGKPPAPAPGTQSESVFFAPRPKIDDTEKINHSAKPEAVHQWIERHFPTMPKIELNARLARTGWDAWGLEAPKIVEPEDENQDRHEYEFNQDAPDQSAPMAKIEMPEFLRRPAPGKP